MLNDGFLSASFSRIKDLLFAVGSPSERFLPDSGYNSRRTSALPPSKKEDVTDRTDSEDVDPNEAFAAELRGKTISIPSSMIKTFEPLKWPTLEADSARWNERDWTRYNFLRQRTDELLERVFENSPKKLQKAKDCDFALFDFGWFPDVDEDKFEDLWTASLFTTWLFVWDDQADSNEGGALSSDYDRACAWRAKSIAQAKSMLGLDDTAPHEDEGLSDTESTAASTSATGTMIVLEEFGKRIQKVLNREQLERLFYEIVRFVDATEVEQAQRLEGYIPQSEDEYFDLRLLSSAVYPCFVILELFSKTSIPQWVWDLSEFQTVYREGNYLICAYNDVMSLKKEVKHNCLINIVPTLYKSGLEWDDVMPTIADACVRSANKLDEAAAKLIQKTSGDKELNEAVIQFVDYVKINCTGNVGYSLYTKRYQELVHSLKADGSLDIVL